MEVKKAGTGLLPARLPSPCGLGQGDQALGSRQDYDDLSSPDLMVGWEAGRNPQPGTLTFKCPV